MEKDEIIADIEQTIAWVTKVIDPITYNKVPFEGSWTAGQVVEHILMVGNGFTQLLSGPNETTTRSVDEHVPRIKTILLDFNTKSIASDNITPEQVEYDIQDHLTRLEKLKTAITTAVKSLDLNRTCIAFDIKTFGHLTGLEATYFFLFHTKKHVHQLQNIFKKLNNPAYIS